MALFSLWHDDEINLGKDDQIKSNLTETILADCGDESLGLEVFKERMTCIKNKKENIEVLKLKNKKMSDEIGNQSLSIENLFASIAKSEEELSKLTKEAEEFEEIKGDDDTINAVNFYEEALGIKASREAGWMIMRISIYHRAEHFYGSFKIRNSDEGGYEVTDCKPAIDNLADLVLKLNETGNAAQFLKRIRQHFLTYYTR